MPAALRLLPFALVTAVAASALAQGDRRSGQLERRTMTPEEIKQRIARSEEFLSRIDTNRNGVIDPEEAEGPQQRFVERILGRAGLEPKFPMPISQIRERLTAAYQNGAASGQPGGPAGGVPGFGVPGGVPPGTSVPGFADPGRVPSTGSVPGFGPTASTPGPAGPSQPPAGSVQPSGSKADVPSEIVAKIRELASSIIQKYDREKKGKLTRDEWPQGQWGTFDEANRQRGNFITMEELVIHLTDLYRQNRLPFIAIGAHSYRFLTALDRLPKGLPSWFLTKDRDGDGQVTMAEFSGEWDSSRLAEFERYDLNDDGIITPAECLKASSGTP